MCPALSAKYEYDLLYDEQIIVIVTKDKNTVVASHAAECVSIGSRCPHLSACRSVIAVAEAAAIVGIRSGGAATVRVKEQIIRAGAVTHDHDSALYREVVPVRDCNDAIHFVRRCIHTEDTALVETGVCADIDPVADLGRGGRGGCTQCNMPGFHRNTVCIRRIAQR